MVKALFALAKYLTWWFIKPFVSRCCVANHTRMLQTSSFNQTHVLVASNSISLSCLEGRIYIIILLNPLPFLHYFIKSIASSRCVEDTPGNTLVHTLVHDKYSPARWVSRKLRPKKRNNSVLYLGLLQVVLFTVRRCDTLSLIWMCLALQRDSRFVSRNCRATDIALTERLGSNGF